MLKRVFTLLLCLFPPLLAIELSVSFGEDKGEEYSVATLAHSTPFMCQKKSDKRFQCTIYGAFPKDLTPHKTKYFTITPQKTPQGTIVTLETELQAKLFATDVDLLKGKVAPKKKQPSKRWQLIAYQEKFPLLKQTPLSQTALNFPIIFPQTQAPSVGPLDVSGNPITVTKDYRDARTFFEIKKSVEEGDYKKAIVMIDKALTFNPKTLFAGEYGYLKLKSLSRTTPVNSQLIMDIGLAWLKDHATEENAPEVLIIVGDAYKEQRDEKEATYYYERTTTDFPETKYAQLALIKQGDMITSQKKVRRAIDFYKQAFVATKDRDVASLAAHKLAKKYELTGEYPKMVEHYQKIFTGNSDYYFDNRQDVLKIMKVLEENQAVDLAIQIGRYVLAKITSKKEPLHEQLLYNLSLLFEKQLDREHAKNGFENYLQLYPKGMYVDDVKKRLSKMILENDELNATSKMAQYMKVINEYKRGELVDTAILKKGQLFFEYHQYENLLAMKSELQALPDPLKKQALPLITQSGTALGLEKLKNKECAQAVPFIKEYKIVVPTSLDVTLFECLLETNNQELAKKISGAYPKKGDPSTQYEWMLRHFKIIKKEKNLGATVALTSDILALAKELNKPSSDPIYGVVYDKFYAAKGLKNDNLMISTLQEIERLFPMDSRTIEPYNDVLLIAIRRNDPLMIQSLARKLIASQERFHVSTYSPWVEFLLSDLLIKQNDLKGAYTLLNQALRKKTTSSEKARILYTQAQIAQKINKPKEALLFLQQCTALKDRSSWGTLCKEGVDVYTK